MKPPAPRPTEPCDLSIALCKARAARILLRCDDDFLEIPIFLKPGEKEEDVREWIRIFAFDALDAALEEAEGAYQKLQGAAIVPPPARQPRARTAKRRAA